MLIVLASIGLVSLISRLGRAMQYAVMTVFAMLLVVWSLYGREGLGYITYENAFGDTYPRVAAALSKIPDREHITLAWGDAGIIPYESGLGHIDPVGLNTNEIAHAKTPAQIVDFLLKQRPDILFIPVSFNADADSCREVFREGHGMIGHSYPELAARALGSGYTAIATIPQEPYDIAVLADTRSTHYADIISTITPLIGHHRDFRAPVKCMR